MQLRPFDPCCLDPDAATTSRSENSETRRRRGLSTVRPQTLTIRQTLRINGSRRSSRRCLLDKNGFELCISTTLRPSRTQELHLGNPAIAKNPWICAQAAKDYRVLRNLRPDDLAAIMSSESASLQPFGCLELQTLRLGNLATAKTPGICVSSSFSATRDSGMPASQQPCSRRKLWNSHLGRLATTKNSGTCAWQSCDDQELRNLRPGSLAATWNSEVDPWQPLSSQELGNLRYSALSEATAQDLQPDGLATIKNSEICILAALRPPETQSTEFGLPGKPTPRPEGWK